MTKLTELDDSSFDKQTGLFSHDRKTIGLNDGTTAGGSGVGGVPGTKKMTMSQPFFQPDQVFPDILNVSAMVALQEQQLKSRIREKSIGAYAGREKERNIYPDARNRSEDRRREASAGQEGGVSRNIDIGYNVAGLKEQLNREKVNENEDQKEKEREKSVINQGSDAVGDGNTVDVAHKATSGDVGRRSSQKDVRQESGGKDAKKSSSTINEGITAIAEDTRDGGKGKKKGHDIDKVPNENEDGSRRTGLETSPIGRTATQKGKETVDVARGGQQSIAGYGLTNTRGFGLGEYASSENEGYIYIEEKRNNRDILVGDDQSRAGTATGKETGYSTGDTRAGFAGGNWPTDTTRVFSPSCSRAVSPFEDSKRKSVGSVRWSGNTYRRASRSNMMGYGAINGPSGVTGRLNFTGRLNSTSINQSQRAKCLNSNYYSNVEQLFNSSTTGLASDKYSINEENDYYNDGYWEDDEQPSGWNGYEYLPRSKLPLHTSGAKKYSIYKSSPIDSQYQHISTGPAELRRYPSIGGYGNGKYHHGYVSDDYSDYYSYNLLCFYCGRMGKDEETESILGVNEEDVEGQQFGYENEAAEHEARARRGENEDYNGGGNRGIFFSAKKKYSQNKDKSRGAALQSQSRHRKNQKTRRRNLPILYITFAHYSNQFKFAAVTLLLFVLVYLYFRYTSMPIIGLESTLISNVLATEKDLLFSLGFKAKNPNLCQVTIAKSELGIFAAPASSHTNRYSGNINIMDENNAIVEGKHLSRYDKDDDNNRGGGSSFILLGNLYYFDEPLVFPSTSLGFFSSLFDNKYNDNDGAYFTNRSSEIRIRNPGSTGDPEKDKDPESDLNKWKSLYNSSFDLTVRGTVRYSLWNYVFVERICISQRFNLTAIGDFTSNNVSKLIIKNSGFNGALNNPLLSVLSPVFLPVNCQEQE
ncbi:hypothetical protein AX774_g972 [Zancudomyces culisetae]|uniref:Vacuolar segregation protein 7 n=1 Tax=Zancudomyces culisetae TaxID=1213189 RepID=A0A1R1PX29_ZANCU|nr:hypothetical protein AX774_g972 [Zancudomyces culisetae]|eukprot:OMH85482.1 hypothetical protein AX774_g972 [Zancudomyces culisetae]